MSPGLAALLNRLRLLYRPTGITFTESILEPEANAHLFGTSSSAFLAFRAWPAADVVNLVDPMTSSHQCRTAAGMLANGAELRNYCAADHEHGLDHEFECLGLSSAADERKHCQM